VCCFLTHLFLECIYIQYIYIYIYILNTLQQHAFNNQTTHHHLSSNTVKYSVSYLLARHLNHTTIIICLIHYAVHC